MSFRSALLLAVATSVSVGCASEANPDASAAGAPSSGSAGLAAGSGGDTSRGGTSAGGTSSSGANAGGAPLNGGDGASGGSGAGASGSGGSAGAQSSAGASPGGAGPAGGTGAGRAGTGPTGPGGRGGAGTGGSAAGGKSGAGGTSAGTGAAGAPSVPLTVFLAGDSTVSSYKDTASTTDQAGWGQMLGALFASGVTVSNRAVGGSTARRFIDEGHFDDLFGALAAGDWVLVQFGTNDGNKTAMYEHDGQMIPYYLDPATDFKTYLERYIEAAQGKQAGIAFVTPPPRNSAYCTGGNGTGGHADAMRQLGADKNVPVLDLNKKSVEYLKAICPSPTPEDFFLLKSDGSVDGTHFQENGARILAGFVAGEMRRVSLPLAALLK